LDDLTLLNIKPFGKVVNRIIEKKLLSEVLVGDHPLFGLYQSREAGALGDLGSNYSNLQNVLNMNYKMESFLRKRIRNLENPIYKYSNGA
jgi:hypothetical protein